MPTWLASASPGTGRAASPLLIEPFVEYCRLRLADDPHLWASTLYDELVELGFTGSYPSLTAAIRTFGLRPHCEPCQPVKGRDAAIIAHPPGEETQWDWLELPDPPAAWQAGRQPHLLVGVLSHSGRWRGVLAPSEDFGHLVEALDAVVARLGGVTRRWRFDRMSTVCYPSSGRLLPTFAAVAKHYAVAVDVCPARRGNRKGVVEKANHSAAQRWWRTLVRVTVAELAQAESLRPAPTVPFPAELAEPRTVTAQGLVSWRGNQYSVPPGLAGARVTVTHRLGADQIRIATAGGAVVAAHRDCPHCGQPITIVALLTTPEAARPTTPPDAVISLHRDSLL